MNSHSDNDRFTAIEHDRYGEPGEVLPLTRLPRGSLAHVERPGKSGTVLLNS